MKRAIPVTLAVFVLSTLLAAAAVQRPARQKPAPQVNRQWWGPPPGGDRERGPRANGPVVAVDANSITLRTPNGFNTYARTATTEVFVDGKPGNLEAIQAGYMANVLFEYAQDLTTPAKVIRANRPQPAGRITSIAGSVVTITDEGGTAWQVTVTQQTRIRCSGIAFTLADLRVGDGARAEGLIDGNNVQARALAFRVPEFKGAVQHAADNSITLKAINQSVIQGTLTDRTVVVIKPRVGPDVPGTRADIKRGMAANIGGRGAEGRSFEVLYVKLLIGQ